MTVQTEGFAVPEWTIGDKLRKAREAAELEQTQLATDLGISRATVTNYERGHVTPRKAVVMAWAMRTRVPVEWLLGGPTGPDQGRRVTGRSQVQVLPREHIAPVRSLRTGASACPERAA